MKYRNIYPFQNQLLHPAFAGRCRHGYGVMQYVENISRQSVTVGPGTLYGAFSTLEKAGLIRAVGEEDRRKYYVLTEIGRLVLAEQIHRLQIMTENGNNVLPILEK